MDDSKVSANTPADTADRQQNPTSGADAAENLRGRPPFTNLSQVDADLALARTLQEQVFVSSALVFFLLPIPNHLEFFLVPIFLIFWSIWFLSRFFG